jgi:hypothetical protein
MYRKTGGIRTSSRVKCKGLSIPFLAAGSDVKNVWDLGRNKKITSVDNLFLQLDDLV